MKRVAVVQPMVWRGLSPLSDTEYTSQEHKSHIAMLEKTCYMAELVEDTVRRRKCPV